jgi:hypothetical protein
MTTDRKFYGTNILVEDFVKTLTKTETLDEGWSEKYIDKATGQEWLKYTVDPDRGYHFNLMLINPPMTTEDIICIMFSSSYMDEVSAAAYKLNLEEQYEHKEYRQKLIDKLKQIDLTAIDRQETERIQNIIQAGQLLNKVNRRNIVGKHYTEIESDAKFFVDIAEKAKGILNQI